MTRVIRSRRAPVSRDLPMYGRVLRLRYLAPSGFLCFVFLEGSIALGILLALAELVSWWGVLVLPAMVALMVKLNDAVAGMVAGPPAATPTTTRRPATPAARSASPGSQGALQGSQGASPASRSAAIRPPAGSNAGWPTGSTTERGTGDLPMRGARGVDLGDRGSGAGRMPDAWGSVATETAAAAPRPVYGSAPGSRHWVDRLDVRQQMARQSAARRYE